MKKAFLPIASLALCIAACTNESTRETPEVRNMEPSGPYFGFAGDTIPQLIMPGLISTPNLELNGTFSPDGKEFVYCVTFPGLGSRLVSTSLSVDNTWSEPEILPFSGPFGGVDPLFSPDGSRLYFTSFRPLDPAGTEHKDADIWYVERTQEGWGEPQNLGMPVNTETNQFYNSVANNGNIYFNMRDSETNFSKIYVAVKTDSSYRVEEIRGMVNQVSVGDPFVSPEEDYLIFVARLDSGLGGIDLYISYKGEEGWGDPILLEAPISSAYDDKMPSVTKDNRFLIFSSGRMQQPWHELSKTDLKEINNKIASTDNGLENIYWVNADFIEKLRPAAKQAPLQAKHER